MVEFGGRLKRVQVNLSDVQHGLQSANLRTVPSPRTPSLRSFVRQLLRAFHDTDVYAARKLDLRSKKVRRRALSSSNLSMLSFAATSPQELGKTMLKSSSQETGKTMLKTIHASCIEDSIDILVRLIGVAAFEDEKDKVRIALEGDPSELAQSISSDDVVKAMQKIELGFSTVVQTLGKRAENADLENDYVPDWKVRNVIWHLIRSVGVIVPSKGDEEALHKPFVLLKEAIFTAMFNGGYLTEQAKRASFKHAVMSHIPTPWRPEASLGWLAIGFFVSVPVASAVRVRANQTEWVFWTTASVLFATVSLANLTFYSAYTSWFTRRLFESVSSNMHADALQRLNSAGKLSLGIEDEKSSNGKSPKSLRASNSPKSFLDSNDDELRLPMDVAEPSRKLGSLGKLGSWGKLAPLEKPVPLEKLGPLDNLDSLDSIQSEDASCTGTLLPLYQVSLLVEKMNCSYFFDERLLIGLTDEQVYDAIQTALNSDIGLGQIFASFSFIGVSISSQGARLTGDTLAERHVRFAFSLFSLVSSTGFLSALLASVLAQLVKRQLSLTQTKEDHTAHEFAGRFGLYIRLIGGLNTFAAVFLATALFHFLLSIYRVSAGITLTIGVLWVIGGALVIETFFSRFGRWTLQEIMEDLGEVVDSPTMKLSSSPVTGSLQIASGFIVGLMSRRGRRGASAGEQ